MYLCDSPSSCIKQVIVTVAPTLIIGGGLNPLSPRTPPPLSSSLSKPKSHSISTSLSLSDSKQQSNPSSPSSPKDRAVSLSGVSYHVFGTDIVIRGDTCQHANLTQESI